MREIRDSADRSRAERDGVVYAVTAILLEKKGGAEGLPRGCRPSVSADIDQELYAH